MKPWASEKEKRKIVDEYFIGQDQSLGGRNSIKCVKRYLVLVESQTVHARKTGSYDEDGGIWPSVYAGVTAGIERGEFCGEHDHIEC